jgi:hypothetical protein
MHFDTKEGIKKKVKGADHLLLQPEIWLRLLHAVVPLSLRPSGRRQPPRHPQAVD